MYLLTDKANMNRNRQRKMFGRTSIAGVFCYTIDQPRSNYRLFIYTVSGPRVVLPVHQPTVREVEANIRWDYIPSTYVLFIITVCWCLRMREQTHAKCMGNYSQTTYNLNWFKYNYNNNDSNYMYYSFHF